MLEERSRSLRELHGDRSGMWARRFVCANKVCSFEQEARWEGSSVRRFPERLTCKDKFNSVKTQSTMRLIHYIHIPGRSFWRRSGQR